jgi:PAS domain S-box-containing protein
MGIPFIGGRSMSERFYKKVLVVDDEPSYRTVVQGYVSLLGYECEGAESAEAALLKLNGPSYDLVISDIQMPGMDGVQLLKHVRDHETAPSFIMMTGHSGVYSYSDIIEAGAVDYLTKPFEIGELKAKLQRLEREQAITRQLKSSHEALVRESRFIAAMADLSKALISSVPIEQIAGLTLKRAQELTASACGCLVEVDTKTGESSLCAAYGGAESVRTAPEHPVVCERCRRLHDSFSVDPRPVIRNSMGDSPDSLSLTPGNEPVDHFLAVPILMGERLIGSIALANSERDYTEHDLQGICRLAEAYVLAIQRKRDEESLAEAKEYLEKVFDNSADAVTIIDKYGRVTKWNKMASILLGYTLEELGDRKIFDLYADKQQLEAMLTQLRRNGSVQKYEIDLRKKDGSLAPFELSISVLKTDQGEVLGSVCVARDLSDVKKLLIEARLINERLEGEIAERRRAEEGVRASQQIIEGILNAIPVRVFWKDNNLVYLGCNEVFARDAGFADPKDIVGKDDYQMVWREQAELYRDDDRQVIESGCSRLHIEEPQKTPEGETITLLTSKIPLRSSEGEIGGVLGTYMDITERKRAEEEARRAHAEMARLVASIPSILIGLSEEDRVLWWNEAAEETFGLKREDVLGRPLRECQVQWNWERVFDGVRQSRHYRAQHRLDDIRYMRSDGKEGFLGISISPMGGVEDAHSGVILLARDVTNRKHMESQLAQAQKLESIGQLAAGIAHEINTPTQYVGDNTRFLQDAFLDLQRLLERYSEVPKALQDGVEATELIAGMNAAAEEADLEYLNEEIPKAIQQSLEGIERISKIVRAMKEFSHPGTEEKTAIDINNAIESTITVARNEWKYVSDVITDFDPQLPLVPCLPGEFNQVILNMIINAAHAIADVIDPGSGEKGVITIATRPVSDGVEIRLSDTGGGIPEAIRSKIFDPFFTTKEVGKGTGQGLAISHSVIVDKHGGTITLETEMGKGTTFIIRLPVTTTTA